MYLIITKEIIQRVLILQFWIDQVSSMKETPISICFLILLWMRRLNCNLIILEEIVWFKICSKKLRRKVFKRMNIHNLSRNISRNLSSDEEDDWMAMKRLFWNDSKYIVELFAIVFYQCFLALFVIINMFISLQFLIYYFSAYY